MSIRFQADNDLKRILVDATLRREPRIDFQTARHLASTISDDVAVLRLAASQSRILVSHDKRSMPRALASFLASGGTSPGVLLVIPQSAPIREVIEALILIWADERAEDWRNRLAKNTSLTVSLGGLTHRLGVITQPRRCRMSRHIAVQNLAACVLDDKETIQRPEGHGRHGKEIHGGDDLAMILQKGQPFPLRVPAFVYRHCRSFFPFAWLSWSSTLLRFSQIPIWLMH